MPSWLLQLNGASRACQLFFAFQARPWPVGDLRSHLWYADATFTDILYIEVYEMGTQTLGHKQAPVLAYVGRVYPYLLLSG